MGDIFVTLRSTRGLKEDFQSLSLTPVSAFELYGYTGWVLGWGLRVRGYSSRLSTTRRVGTLRSDLSVCTGTPRGPSLKTLGRDRRRSEVGHVEKGNDRIEIQKSDIT